MRLIVCLLALALAAGCDRENAPAPQGTNTVEGTTLPAGPALPTKGVDRSKAGTPAPDVIFQKPDGGPFDLGKFKGTPVLVNLWATWCAPCVKELPTLEALEKKHLKDGTLGIAVVSQDMGPKTSVDAFLKSKGIGLLSYLDPEMKLTGALGVEVMPTTILYDAQGREVWRYVGDLDWTGPEATKLLSEASVPNG